MSQCGGVAVQTETIYSTNCPEDQSRSNTYIYVTSWAGELLYSARLTQQMLWRMRKLARKSKSNNKIAAQEVRSSAQVAWNYCFTFRHHIMTKDSFDMIANTWVQYFSTAKMFSLIADARFEKGMALVAVGWALKNGATRVFPVIAPSNAKLSDSNLRVIADHVMVAQRQRDPQNLPYDFDLS